MKIVMATGNDNIDNGFGIRFKEYEFIVANSSLYATETLLKEQQIDVIVTTDTFCGGKNWRKGFQMMNNYIHRKNIIFLVEDKENTRDILASHLPYVYDIKTEALEALNIFERIFITIESNLKNNEEVNYNELKSIQNLNKLIGLSSVKEQVRKIMNFIIVEKIKQRKGKSEERPMLHMTFEGPAGTGKTTVARILADFYEEVNYLEVGHLVEVSRSGLVANYLGQTANKTQEKIQEALDGVLFIDEAYSLSRDKYGEEAIDELIKAMEDHRDKMVVIMAGYPKEMEKLLQINSGFQSRIPFRLHFPHYTQYELSELANLVMKEKKLEMNSQAKKIMDEHIYTIFSQQQKIEGNGRWIRNFIEKVQFEQCTRIVETNEENITLITEEDVIKAISLETKKDKNTSLKRKIGFI